MVSSAIPTTIHPLQPNSEYRPPSSYKVLLIFFKASVPLSRYQPKPSRVYSSSIASFFTLFIEGTVYAHGDVLQLRYLVLHVVDQALALFVAGLTVHAICVIIQNYQNGRLINKRSGQREEVGSRSTASVTWSQTVFHQSAFLRIPQYYHTILLTHFQA